MKEHNTTLWMLLCTFIYSYLLFKKIIRLNHYHLCQVSLKWELRTFSEILA